MLTALENAWFGLQLDQYLRHPVHDGWREACKRWLTSPTFEQHLQKLLPEFSHDLQEFIRQMRDELRRDQQPQGNKTPK